LLVTVAAVIAAIVVWVGTPLWQGVAPLASVEPVVASLLSRRESILASLRDLEADRADDRVAEEDYARLHDEMVAEGAATLAALDRVAGERAVRTTRLVTAIEAEVTALVGGGSGNVTPVPAAGPAVVCPACGRPAAHADRFCAGCGRPLVEVEGR
jgi:hypothetical protein